MVGMIVAQLFASAALVAAGVINSSLKPRQAPALSIEQCPGYVASNVQYSNDKVVSADLSLAGTACNVYGADLVDLKLLVEYQTGELSFQSSLSGNQLIRTDERLHVKIYDEAEQVYQVPESVLPRPATDDVDDGDLVFTLTESPFSFAITRKEGGEVLFNTSGSALIFESQYLRLRTSLPNNPHLYGLGEHTDPFMLNTTNYTRT
jgi:alpha-glucosidase